MVQYFSYIKNQRKKMFKASVCIFCFLIPLKTATIATAATAAAAI